MEKLQVEYTGSGTGKRYTIASKIKVAEAVIAGESINSISEQTGVAIGCITSWVGDFKMGKYTLENTTQIVRKPKTSLTIVLEEAQKAANEANARVQRIKDAMDLLVAEGIKVA